MKLIIFSDLRFRVRQSDCIIVIILGMKFLAVRESLILDVIFLRDFFRLSLYREDPNES